MNTTLQRHPNALQLTGAAAGALTLTVLVLANFANNDGGENGGAAPFALSLVVGAALIVWLFGRVIPRAVEAGAADAARTALILAVLALVAWGFFWTGLPFILGPAAALLGRLSAERGGGAKATAATALGVVAVMAALALAVADELDLA